MLTNHNGQNQWFAHMTSV